ncbi:IPT/TIG domain-containing protein [Chitinophaga nivalis]|uniref:IPT/TIG domain-containing protein n=1 Tax=Chitinophaga nivalis TaxID=2991709 RepID=A0ABT3IVK5_9BACT|nr:IPT/TIG domain-containing protein [Chitinophaga nivalis]MCW3462316.1 IPT/TIG domain-containing protein [Chitinophaga nivalis]MCW3487993.1 IPT/TIG domain-containing protein [Chitinophaga nivalis]
MKHFNMFAVALVLLITAMSACAPNPKENTKTAYTVSGHAGNFLVIKGHGFSRDKAANKVVFGNVPAQVLQAGPDFLLVQVPLQKPGTVPVVVEVGAHTSNAMLFVYNPARKLVADISVIAI